jgi:hypothetical protein
LFHLKATGGSVIQQFETTGGTVARTWKNFVSSSTGAYHIQDATASANRVIIDTSGNVGIGTASPDTTLHLSASNNTSPVLRLERNDTFIVATDQYGAIEFEGQDANTSASGVRGSIRGIGEGEQGQMALTFSTATGSTSETERMRIDSSGNVGIGTDSPNSLIEAKSTAPALRLTDSTDNSYTRLRYEGAAFLIEVDDASGATGSNFRIQVDGTEAMRIDSSGNVGIGTTDPTVASGNGLAIYDSVVPRVQLRNSTSGDTSGDGAGIFMSGSDLGIENRESSNIIFYNNTEKMRIDSSGNVGIGVTNPSDYYSNDLVVSSANEQGITLAATSTGVANYLMFADGTSGDARYVGHVGYDHATDNLFLRSGGLVSFKTGGGTERMRIDSSGNLLVGTTSTSVGAATSGSGFRVDGANGIVQAAASDYTSAIFNRTSSDGGIVDFRKNGSSVGGIGTVDSDFNIFPSAGGHKGLRFGNGYIAPTSNGTTVEDASTDLGLSSYRFKDLYLSGGAYLGGTGSANHLDDYEEGTFSGSNQGSTYSGTYTKVGRICHISITIDNSSSTGTQMATLPFSAKNGGTAFNGTQPTFNTSSSLNDTYIAPFNGGSVVYLYSKSGATQNVSTGTITANWVYETD